MRRVLFVASIAAVACGYSHDRFQQDAIEATCEWLVECYELYADVDSCISETRREETGECVVYDSKNARDCVRGLRDLTCDAAQTPAACANVYDWGDCDTGA